VQRCGVDHTNYLPVGVSEKTGRVQWREVGACPFTHSVFQWSLDAWDPQWRSRPSFLTDLSLFAREDFALEGIVPSLFVFHMSRCGSCVLVRALAQSPRIVVMSEVPALNRLLFLLCEGRLGDPIVDVSKLRILRRFLLALGRRRDPAQRHYVVKLTSWNVVLFDSIRAAFPEVPCLFLYRDPAEVVVAAQRRPAGIFREKGTLRSASWTGLPLHELEAMSQLEYVAHCLQRIMSAALAAPEIDYLSYVDSRRESLPRLLGHYGIQVPPEELAAMCGQFDFDAKSRQRDARFEDDTEEKRRAVTDEIREVVGRLLEPLHRRLEASPRNLRAEMARAAS
jgi:hypothetical protein